MSVGHPLIIIYTISTYGLANKFTLWRNGIINIRYIVKYM